MKSDKLGMFLLSCAFAACGDNDVATTSGLLGVFPSHGFTGRTKRVEITGDSTAWTDGASVSFGDGVTVSSVEVASPTDLFADISVDTDATTGMRDVTVTSGGTLVLKDAFELVPPVELVAQGTVAQGGFPTFMLVNHDPENPFDTTLVSNSYPHLRLSGPANVKFYIDNATADTVYGGAYIDLDATAGDLRIQSGSGATAVTSNCGTFGIMARAPTPITGSTTGMVTELGDSALYSVAATGTPSLVHISVTTGDTQAVTGVAIFPDNSWADIITAPRPSPHEILAGPATVTFFVGDFIHSGYQYNVSAVSETPTSAAEGDDTTNGTSGGALVATALPFEQRGGTLSSATDRDFISFTISAANANRRAHVVTNAGADVRTDTKVDLYSAVGKDYLVSYGAVPVDGTDCYPICYSSGEDVVSDPLPAGTYYVVISAGPAYSLADQAYTALIWLD